MNLSNVHTFEKNKAYFKELPVIHECQGNIEDYFVALIGHWGNEYTFVVEDDETKEIFNIKINDNKVFDWRIREGCNGLQRETKVEINHVKFVAIGILLETNEQVALESKTNDLKIIECAFINKKKEFNVINVIVKNYVDINNIYSYFNSFNYDLEINQIFTRHYFNTFRDERFKYSTLFNKLKYGYPSKINYISDYEPDDLESDSEEEHY